MVEDERPATVADVHSLALAMPHVTTDRGDGPHPLYRVGSKAFVYFRRPRADLLDPDTGQRIDDAILIWVEDELDKQALVQDPSTPFFTAPHFDGHPSVIIRAGSVGAITRGELTEIVQDAWLARASNRRAQTWLDEHQPGD